jgi:hypothetical protein
MTIICNNLIIGKKEEPKRQAPPPKPNTVENLSIIERKSDDSELIVAKGTKNIKNENVKFHKGYHTIQEGELHKLINSKSDYLSDMLGLKD